MDLQQEMPAENESADPENVSYIGPKSTQAMETLTIDRILAKRFNPRRREDEFLIKWQKLTQDLNTWESRSNLSECEQLLHTFEVQLARQKVRRAEKTVQEASDATAAAVAELEKLRSKGNEIADENVPRIVKKPMATSEMQVVQAILAKRFNPRRCENEYLIKWAERSNGQNTWEPQSELHAFQPLLNVFEIKLAQQKQRRAEEAAKKVAQGHTDQSNAQ